ncbi:hypothetical protein Tco_0422381 [Tanacetum coccineum]
MLQGAMFNMFNSNAGLEEVPLGGCIVTWWHKSLLIRGFFHYWFDMEGFDKLVEESWKAAPVADTIAIIKMMKKLKYLKENIHRIASELGELQSCDRVATKGAKIKWAIKGDDILIGIGNTSKKALSGCGDPLSPLLVILVIESYKSRSEEEERMQEHILVHRELRGYSFRRDPRGSVEKAQFDSMLEKVEGTLLADMRDRWMLSLEGSVIFLAIG